MAHDSLSPATARIQRVIASRPISAVNARVLHHLDRWVLRLSGGRTSAMALLAGLPVVNLTTIGAKSVGTAHPTNSSHAAFHPQKR